ncbi:divergent polysaccharide deacetylase family protein [Aestuariibacter sp. AA17]|uniref:Divergent polysaccharide deacetylase family protein n=1 Tax=Fluctibacter corallii TaxID=2984329 RepID=A0ABT3A7Z4_9ALTE|nr:divergent polysaccharide deacetylase family protein [Aestuariibacter sp. AA17]MCV2884407.1 divergent polysaccharide deacetylase family protein [Aestuariibacter sp. AA17]
MRLIKKTIEQFCTAILLFFIAISTMSSGNAAEIAIIIDDMGNARRDAKAFDLPKEVTLSILPHTPLSRQFSQRAAKQQREVMLHVPMESLGNNRLGPGAITSDMHPQAIKQTLSSALKSVPHAIGVNNHMGSKLTQLTLPMKTTMEFLQEENLFFVDSRTTRFSKASKIAQEVGILSGHRSVFIDHVIDPDHIDQQFKRLIRLAKKYNQVIGIAHPYPQSLAYLENALTELDGQGVRLIPVSEMLKSIELSRKAQHQQNNQPTSVTGVVEETKTTPVSL